MSKKYTNIIRAQLTKYELILLFHNTIGITRSQGRSYLKLVEKYQLLEHLQLRESISVNPSTTDSLLCCYKHSAFGENRFMNDKIKELSKRSGEFRKLIMKGSPTARDALAKLTRNTS